MGLVSLQKLVKVSDDELSPHTQPWLSEAPRLLVSAHPRSVKLKSCSAMEIGIRSRIMDSMYSDRGSTLYKSLPYVFQIHSRRILIPSVDSDMFSRSKVAIDTRFGGGGCKAG